MTQNPVLLELIIKMNSQIKNKAVYWGTGRRKPLLLECV